MLLLLAGALAVGVGFVWRLLTAPEPLIPIAILPEPIVRWSVIANSFGWAAIIGLNIFLPMYLQSVIGLSPTNAGLSLMVLMVTLNTSAGPVRPGARPRDALQDRADGACMVIAFGSVVMLALWADRMTLLSFEVLLFLIGAGFGPLPSLCTVAMQNAVERHQLGHRGRHHELRAQPVRHHADRAAWRHRAGGTILACAGRRRRIRRRAAAGRRRGREAFRRVFFAVAACLAVAFVAPILIEEKPLRSGEVREES